MDQPIYELETEGESCGHCDCCGQTTRRVWGWLHTEQGTVASYFWAWTKNSPEHGALIDLVFGTWGEGAGPDSRSAARVEFRAADDGPAFRVIDATVPGGELANHALRRSDVIDTPLAPKIFEMLDAIWLGDGRLDELRQW